MAKSAGAGVRGHLLDDGPGNGEAIEGGGAAADFVEEDETRFCGGVQDGGDFGHFHEKRGAAAGKIGERSNSIPVLVTVANLLAIVALSLEALGHYAVKMRTTGLLPAQLADLKLAQQLSISVVWTSFLHRFGGWPYLVFFLGVTLTCFGSAYYHIAHATAPVTTRLRQRHGAPAL